MENFIFQSPVKIIFGKGAVDTLGDELSAFGNRTLFVYGRQAVKDIGLHEQIISSLACEGVTCIEYGGIRPNPLLSEVRKGIAIAREMNAEVILAAGGGSVIDAAKAIAVGSAVDYDIWKLFTGKKSVAATLPVISVPTVAGSGSEANHGMVLTHDESRLKFGFGHRLLYPRVCLADPSLTYTVDQAQTGCGCVDVLCHCLEPYLTSAAEGIEFQRRFLENVCKTVVESASGCIDTPSSYEHRAAMHWASIMAMSPVSAAGLGRVHHPLHVIEHGLSAIHDLPHGAGLAALLPGWLEYCLPACSAVLAQWGKEVFKVKGDTVVARAKATVSSLTQFLISLGCSVRLKDLGLAQQDLKSIAAHAVSQNRIRRNPGLDEKMVMEVLTHCL